MGHTNLSIPSTLGGSVYNLETGHIDVDNVKQNLDLAASIYIDYVNNSPCGEAVMQLFKGSASTDLQNEGK